MKPALPILFVIGSALGWWLTGTGTPLLHRTDASTSQSTTAPGIGSVESTGGLPHLTDDQVEISPDRLKSLIQSPDSPCLTLTSFVNGSQQRNLDRLTAWLELDPATKATLDQILRETVRERLAWEKSQVKVESPAPGKWKLHFPSDGGAAREALMAKIAAAFDPQTAEAIGLGADLESFFNLGDQPDRPQHGDIWIKVGRRNEEGDSEGPVILTFTGYFNGEPWFESQAPAGNLGHPHLARFLPHLGTKEEILKAAPEE